MYAVSGMVMDQAGLAQLDNIKSHYANNTRELSNLTDRWSRILKISGDQNIIGESSIFNKLVN